MPDRIIIRNDDVLLSATHQFDDSFARFKRVHDLICQTNRLVHVPALVTKELQAFPEAVSFIQEETKAGRMAPELHGLTHIDYAPLSKTQVIEALSEAKDWFEDNLGYAPKKWYTPWGANAPHLFEAAEFLGLKAIDCSDVTKFKGRYGVTQLISENKPVSFFLTTEIIMHWWNKLDVERLEFFVNHVKSDETRSNN